MTQANGFDPSLAYMVACTYPRRELMAAEQLSNMGYPVFVPFLTHHETRWRTAPHTALFPGYAFVHLHDGNFAALRRARAVSRPLYAVGGAVKTIAGTDLEPFHNGQEAGLFDLRLDVTRLPPGTPVKVLGSWLSDRLTTLRSADPFERQAVIEYFLLGASREITVPLENVRAVG